MSTSPKTLKQRLFLGFAPDESQRRQLQALQRELQHRQTTPQGWRPVLKDNLHLTLAFLGGCSPEQRRELELGIGQIHKPRFAQRLERLQLWRGPGVLCLGEHAEDDGLLQLYRDSQTLAGKLGLQQSEHGFHPHITLFRKAKAGQLPTLSPEPLTLKPEQLHLYWSESTPSGVRYRILHSWDLG
ncbi:RNA 2',3'-cyclic phosphodiesterase [Shewanella sedimentimangrovi]|uniref:RNA 2',3'-cyclic phosphodiesterase n=1 Tax=Shewanella sedimentimangrovi TaxID=2814293 RepID=A0ABX7QZ29_9GAMM|nr:RNA 2',3'-cyclic phosphodiesterase [Shewanella sedimentimangrovi]QSX36499.1 RNA 2',3'-cyclic phosphodiesterase [Shewanella sedimentimangrovi]